MLFFCQRTFRGIVSLKRKAGRKTRSMPYQMCKAPNQRQSQDGGAQR